MRVRFSGQSWACALVLLIAIPLWPQDKTEYFQGNEAAAQEVLVRFRAETLTSQKLSQILSANDIELMEGVDGAGLVLLRSRSKGVAELVGELAADPDVVYAEPNYILRIAEAPDDPRFGELYGLQNTGQSIRGVLGVPGADISGVPAWDITTGATANVVAVVDTGVDFNHLDLADNVWSAHDEFTVTIGELTITCPAGSHGFNAITNSCSPLDDNNHGTHVSGTVGPSEITVWASPE